MLHGAGTGAGQGTLPEGINLEDEITGGFADSNSVSHGFLRYLSGAITTFDAPGAGTAPNQGTFPLLNNIEGAISGYDVDGNGVSHGFVRTP